MPCRCACSHSHSLSLSLLHRRLHPNLLAAEKQRKARAEAAAKREESISQRAHEKARSIAEKEEARRAAQEQQAKQAKWEEQVAQYQAQQAIAAAPTPPGVRKMPREASASAQLGQQPEDAPS